MVRKMLLEYLVLFEELMEISKKITINTVSQEEKQRLTDTTMSIVKDITYILNYASQNGYNISKGKEFLINLVFQSHKERLYYLIEELGFRKKCSKCGRGFPITPKYFYRDCKARDGYRNDCKECHKAIKKESYHQNKKCSENIEEEELISEEYENIIQE